MGIKRFSRFGVFLAAGIGILMICLFPAACAHAQDSASETLAFEIHIEPVFVVESGSEESGNVNLGPLRSDETASQTTRVVVHTNRTQPYRITQHLEQNLLSNHGFDLSEEPILFSVSDGLHGGKPEVTGAQALTTEPMVIFSSSPDGAADEFTITYSSASRKLIPAGIYRARLLIEGELR